MKIKKWIIGLVLLILGGTAWWINLNSGSYQGKQALDLFFGFTALIGAAIVFSQFEKWIKN
jgi:hypothetical protein